MAAPLQRGIAVYLDGGGGNALANDDSDNALDALDDVMELACERLLAAGLTVALETQSELLVAAPLPPLGAAALCRQVIATARSLMDELDTQLTAQISGAARVSIVVHVDRVALGPDGELAAGPLMELSRWPRSPEPRRIHVTPEAQTTSRDPK
jgi:hypothetical protein